NSLRAEAEQAKFAVLDLLTPGFWRGAEFDPLGHALQQPPALAARELKGERQVVSRQPQQQFLPAVLGYIQAHHARDSPHRRADVQLLVIVSLLAQLRLGRQARLELFPGPPRCLPLAVALPGVRLADAGVVGGADGQGGPPARQVVERRCQTILTSPCPL